MSIRDAELLKFPGLNPGPTFSPPFQQRMLHLFNACGRAHGVDRADTFVFPLALILTELLSAKKFFAVFFANPKDLTLDLQVLQYHHHCMILLAVLLEITGLVDVESEFGSEIRVRIRDCRPKTEKIEYR